MSRDPFEELFGPMSDDTGGDGDDALDNAATAQMPQAQPPVQAKPQQPAPAQAPTQRFPARRSTALPLPGEETPTAATTPVSARPTPMAADVPVAPMPARQRLAHEQAERVMTAQLPTPKRGGIFGADGRNAKSLPWLIVAVVAIIAIVVSIIVVNVARGTDEAATAPADTSTSESTAPTPEAEPDAPKTPAPKPVEKPKPKTKAPVVEVGPVWDMQIGPWNADSDISQRLGSVTYSVPDGVNLELSATLLDSFPDSCADTRGAWGATRLEDGTYQVRKPAESCAAAPELYDEVWGLVDAWVATIRPM